VEKRLKNIIMVTGAPALGTFILSYVLLPHFGIFGTGIGWLVAQSIVAIIIAPQIMKRLRYPEAYGSHVNGRG